MFIKNATVYGCVKKPVALQALLENRFTPVGSSEAQSSGWGEVFEEQPVLTGAGGTLLAFVSEKKVIPASAVITRLQEKLKAIFDETGFLPGKKMRKELKERVIDEMLPTAFASRSRTYVWIDFFAGRIIVDSASNSVCDAVIKALVKVEDLGIEMATWPRAKVVTEWLLEPPADFTNDDAVTLRYPGEHGKVVKFSAANLDENDVQQHVQKGGAAVDTLAMTFDDRISFTMTANDRLRSIKPLDIITSGDKPEDLPGEFALMALEMRKLLNALTGAA